MRKKHKKLWSNILKGRTTLEIQARLINKIKIRVTVMLIKAPIFRYDKMNNELKGCGSKQPQFNFFYILEFEHVHPHMHVHIYKMFKKGWVKCIQCVHGMR
jgi:hypothetical protein